MDAYDMTDKIHELVSRGLYAPVSDVICDSSEDGFNFGTFRVTDEQSGKEFLVSIVEVEK